ncbi:MAG: transketolase [Lentisphaerae bacterium RIFOXYA12_FULL_48_11]|nr:MAG: transketolase [Lentisphaerae bacterium RIFOXYA12_FULL_48_11]
MKTNITNEDLKLAANTIRGLAMDGVQKANSGHPGMPMGMADVAAVLFLKYLKHCPTSPNWTDRDRFVLSGGHGSMLLYSMLHLSGYGLPVSELAAFRQWNSKTPGHPEYRHTAGVETTTGPLGQGCGNATGMAIAEKMLAERFNTPDFKPVDHYTFAMCGDGDLMEGISHEVFSLAGHLGLNKLILFYDSNKITIEGSTDLACSDNVKKRFQGYNWSVLEIDGHDYDQIDKAIRKAMREKSRPTIIVCRTHIAHGSPNKHDTAGAHGEPLGADEVKASKKNLGLPEDKDFYVPEKVKELFADRLAKMQRVASKWERNLSKYFPSNPDKADLWKKHFEDIIPENINELLPQFDPAKPIASRAAGGTVLQKIAAALPQLVGGSADLAPSNKSYIEKVPDVKGGSFAGRNFHFGIREHGMGAILNGMALHGGFHVYGATFFVFSDYCRPALRLAAIMNLPVIYIFTHDSFYVGEDGPTHEPVEHMASLRCMPNMTILRPADPTETAAAWVAALKNKTGPSALLLTRQNLPVIDRSKYPAASNVEKGAYTLLQTGQGTPNMLLIASGSEVSLAMDAANILAKDYNVRVVSMPSWELFEKQPEAYRKEVLPAECRMRLAIEAGCSFGWHKYVGDRGRTVCLDRFGASAPYKVLAENFGFTVQNVVSAAKEMAAANK